MSFPANKTKLVCTIGPASDSPRILEQMILAGMNVARLNFSHGDSAGHQETIKNIRAASEAVGLLCPCIVHDAPESSTNRPDAPDTTSTAVRT